MAVTVNTSKFVGNRVYFAVPFFYQSEKYYNLKIATILKKHRYTVFLPQREGFEAAMLRNKTEAELTIMIFEKDVSEILKVELFFNFDSRIPNKGACVELGIAYANQKSCYSIKPDTRSAEFETGFEPNDYRVFQKSIQEL